MELLKNENILITSSQFYANDDTYILNSVQFIRKKCSRNIYPLSVMTLMFMFFLCGFIGLPESCSVTGLLLTLAVVRWESKNHKVNFSIHLGMPTGTFKVLESEDEEYIDNVISTLRGAVSGLHHG